MVAWIEQYGQIIGFFIQLAFYVVVAVSALWAAIVFSHYVKFMTSEDAEDTETPEAPSKISVDAFVE